MSDRRPGSWAELLDRFAFLLSDEEAAKEWLRQALDAGFGVLSPIDLDRRCRQVAFQKLSGVLLAVEDLPGDLAFVVGQRGELQEVFARFLAGTVLEGPPWRVGPNEMHRPTRSEWEAEAEF